MTVVDPKQSQAFKDNEDLLKRMNKSLDKKIASKEQEIKDVDSLYEKKIDLAKTSGEEDFVASLDRNQKRIIGESNQFEEKIKNYQDRLKKASETVDQEEAIIRSGHKTRIENMKNENEENFQDQFIKTTELSQQIQNSTQDTIKEIAAKSRTEKSLLEGEANTEINALSSDLNNKNVNIEKNFRDKLENDIRVHNAEVGRQRSELKNVMTVEAEKNKRLSAEKIRVNNEQLIYQDKHQEDMLKQREVDFKIRYENLVKEHDSIIKNISSKLDSDIKKMVISTSTEKKNLMDRSEDPFYRVETLNPKMYEDLKTVTVELPVADFEKENVQLSVQGRDIKITLSRKYIDGLTDQNGNLNKSTRSELYSKEMKAVDILSAKNITQKYADGVLTFKIKKA